MAERYWPVAETVNQNPCRSCRTWWTGTADKILTDMKTQQSCLNFSLSYSSQKPISKHFCNGGNIFMWILAFWVKKFMWILAARATFRTPWKRCCFSGDGEYIVAGSARQHALYIWEKSIGNLVKILHGTRGELLLDVAVRVSVSFFSKTVILNLTL